MGVVTSIAVLGVGAVGARVARQLLSIGGLDRRGAARRARRPARHGGPLAGRGRPHRHRGYAEPLDVDVVVLAGPPGTQLEPARRFVAAGISVVSVSDEIAEVRALLDLDVEARERGVTVAVGTGFAPGLSCVLAAYAAVAVRRGRRDPRGQGRHRRPGLRPPAPPGAAGPGPRLARPGLGPAPGRQRPGAVLVPRSDRRRGLLPGRAARRPAAGAGLPGRGSGDGPHGGHPPRPPDGPAADAVAVRIPRAAPARSGSRSGAAGAPAATSGCSA